jgi:hypothetical protein
VALSVAQRCGRGGLGFRPCATETGLAWVGTRGRATSFGQPATVHPTPCHLAARTPSTPRINSPRRFHLSPTVRRDPTVPTRRQRAAGSTQSGHRVPTRTRPHLRRPAPQPTWHGAVDPLPPSPCPLLCARTEARSGAPRSVSSGCPDSRVGN